MPSWRPSVRRGPMPLPGDLADATACRANAAVMTGLEEVDMAALEAVCERFVVAELSIFGSTATGRLRDSVLGQAKVIYAA